MRTTFCVLWSLLLIPLLSGAPAGPKPTPATQPAGVPADIWEFATGYHNLQQITPKPAQVNWELTALCRGADLSDIERARKTMGPHAYSTVMIYMNDSAAAAFKNHLDQYPIGSVVIKEKKGGFYRSGTGDRGKMVSTGDGVGGMIKRDKGFDPDHGDWEYFYFENPQQIDHGKIASCVNCHAAAASRGYVFGNWAHQRGL
jgi:hypothetical protein